MTSTKVSNQFSAVGGDLHHVVAAHTQLHEATAIITALPPVLSSGIESLLKSYVCWAVSSVTSHFAYGTSDPQASWARRPLIRDTLHTDESRAQRIRAVSWIWSIELEFLLLVSLDQVICQEFANTAASGD